MVDLGLPPGSDANSSAYPNAISGNQVVGYVQFSGSAASHAVLWRQVPPPVVTISVASPVVTFDAARVPVDLTAHQ